MRRRENHPADSQPGKGVLMSAQQKKDIHVYQSTSKFQQLVREVYPGGSVQFSSFSLFSEELPLGLKVNIIDWSAQNPDFIQLKICGVY